MYDVAEPTKMLGRSFLFLFIFSAKKLALWDTESLSVILLFA